MSVRAGVILLSLATPAVSAEELLALTGLEWMSWSTETRVSIVAGYVMALSFLSRTSQPPVDYVAQAGLKGKEMELVSTEVTHWYKSTGYFHTPIYVAIYARGVARDAQPRFRAPDTITVVPVSAQKE